MTDGDRGDRGGKERKDEWPDSSPIQLLITEGAWRLCVCDSVCAGQRQRSVCV